MWWDNARPASVLVSRRSVPGVSSRHEQLRSHRTDSGERRLEDQHGLCGPQKSCYSCGKQLLHTHICLLKCANSPNFTCTCVSTSFPLGTQKFNPKIFKKKQKNGSSPKPSCPYCCCAVGSKDRSLSVWVSPGSSLDRDANWTVSVLNNILFSIPSSSQLTSLKRPLVVIHDLFDKSIMDISW